MTRIGKTEEEGLGMDDDSLESVLDEIPDQLAWMNNFDYDSMEPFDTSDVVVQEASGGGGSSGVLHDYNSLYSFHPRPPPPPPGNLNLTQFGGSSVVSDHRSQMFVGGGDLSPNSVSMGMNTSSEGLNSTDEEELCRYLNRIGVSDDVNVSDVKYRDVDFIGFRVPDDPYLANERVESLGNGVYGYEDFRNGGEAGGVVQSRYLSCVGIGGMMSPTFLKGRSSDNLFQYPTNPRRSGPSFPPPPPLGYSTLPIGRQNVKELAPYTYCQEVSQSNFSNVFNGVSRPETLYYTPKTRMNFNEGDGILNAPNIEQVMMHQNQRHALNIRSELQMSSNSRMPQGGLQDINREGSFILQGQGMNPVATRNVDCLWRPVKGLFTGSGGSMLKGKHTHQVPTSKFPRGRVNHRLCSPGVISRKHGILSAIYGQLADVAKQQTQCRLLQDVIEQRNPQDIEVIFDEIIEHVVELMINPFGNYFMQKLLDVCSEEQRTKIIDVAAKEPWVLVRVSMNDHGTRVTQKLIETAKTREQILKITAALKPGFYALITDSNGNHVIERCLHCFTNEQNKFIFVAAIEYCTNIATDQYGCCVLQKCIGHSTVQYRDRLVAEILNHAFVLSQDAFGNYAVQFILDMNYPPYTSRLISQLRGKYVHLAMQKCSSHVVEKCLKVFNTHDKSQIIHELLSFNHFEQLLQDPHANYVIQTALKVSEGSIHQRLVQEIKLYKKTVRLSPYSKGIFASEKKKKK